MVRPRKHRPRYQIGNRPPRRRCAARHHAELSDAMLEDALEALIGAYGLTAD